MIDLRHARIMELGAENLDQQTQFQPTEVTAIIPAAGRGSRLGFDKPKILYPLAGRPILAWLLDELKPLCEKFVFVLSGHGAPIVSEELERLIPGRYQVAIQCTPLGMGDAVQAADGCVNTPISAVLWGDQVGFRGETLRACIEAHKLRENAVATCPTVLRDKPYIHFERDNESRLTRILQAREGDVMPAHGESDCGLFVLQTEYLFPALKTMRNGQAAWGASTKEFNFLPILPLLDKEPGNVCCVRIADSGQSAGINTAADAEQVASTLAQRVRPNVS